MKSVLLAILFACFLHTGTLFAQAPDFSGTWILNIEKSTLEHKGEGFTGSKFIIEQKGNKMHLTRYHYYGEKDNKLHFKMTADGKTRPVKLLFKGKLEPIENGLRASIWKKNFSNIVNYTYGSSTNELVADEVMKSKANNHHNIWVFDKAEPVK